MAKGKQSGDGSRSYAGPFIDPREYCIGGDFVSDQAFVDAVYTVKNLETETDRALGIDVPSPAADRVQARSWFVNGSYDSARQTRFGGNAGTPFDFASHPPSPKVVAVVAAVKAYLAQKKADKHPDFAAFCAQHPEWGPNRAAHEWRKLNQDG